MPTKKYIKVGNTLCTQKNLFLAKIPIYSDGTTISFLPLAQYEINFEIKTTNGVIYKGICDCSNLPGKGDVLELSENFWDKFLNQNRISKISEKKEKEYAFRNLKYADALLKW